MLCYSYVRFSTPDQAKGDSYRRQMEFASNYCKLHNLTLVEDLSFKDLGVSTKTFLPIFRGHDYSAITSGGLRTILSIGYYLSLMNLSIKMNINYPNFIMIDTVGKCLGKTGTYEIAQSIDNEVDEGLTDPEKYRNIYAEILNITELAKSKDISCQIIIVDNDIPDHIKKCEDDFVVEHFSTIGVVKSKIGLIDDL